MQAIGASGTLPGGTADFVDAIELPALVYDSGGRVLHANHSARRRLGRDLLVRLGNAERELPAHENVVIRRLDEEHSWYATFVRIGRPPEQVVVVTVNDAATPRTLPATRLRELFGLTPAEIRLVHALAATCSMVTAAEQLKISAETARTHLKHIFSKTGTTSQAQVLRLIDRLGFFAEPIRLLLPSL